MFKNKCSSRNHLSMQMSTRQCWHWKCFWERISVLKLIRSRETSPSNQKGQRLSFRPCWSQYLTCVWLAVIDGQRVQRQKYFGKHVKAPSLNKNVEVRGTKEMREHGSNSLTKCFLIPEILWEGHSCSYANINFLTDALIPAQGWPGCLWGTKH